MRIYRDTSICKHYPQRNSILKDIGYGSYSEYLNSEEWKLFRRKYLSKHKNCACCGDTATIIHHIRYTKDVLLLNSYAVKQYLRPLCNKCHYDIEFNNEGDKLLTAGEVKSNMLNLMRKNKHMWPGRCIICACMLPKKWRHSTNKAHKKCLEKVKKWQA